MLILGLESSCDETAASVVADGRRVLSNVVATQHDLHERYAGVVPEIASRAHVERILPVVRSGIEEAGVAYADLDAIAVGNRPGLIGSLLVGVSAAKALAWSLQKPLIGVDHVIAHLFAGMLDADEVTWPALGLVVSGGHTSLFRLEDPLDVTCLGRTIDDAAGEAFDKAASILQLGYPGGPLVDALAKDGNDRAHDLPVSRLGRESLDFSFSGLKTSLLYAVCGRPEGRGAAARLPRDASSLSHGARADFAASFQRAAVKAVMLKLERAYDREPAGTLLVGGGVSANSRLRDELRAFAGRQGLDLRLPPLSLCLDNGAMIAAAAHARLMAGEQDDLTLSARPR
ncbi:MAG: tRNA (adenosine(37)-N6)-threonylcarbamoyltransferase complex transferase subunit TsaD [Planctomycetota bacterium]